MQPLKSTGSNHSPRAASAQPRALQQATPYAGASAAGPLARRAAQTATAPDTPSPRWSLCKKEQDALVATIKAGKRLRTKGIRRLEAVLISADLPGYLCLCSGLGYTLQKRSVRDHLFLMRVMQEKEEGSVPASLKGVENPIAQAKLRTPSPVRRLAERPKTLPGESPEVLAAPKPRPARTTQKNTTRPDNKSREMPMERALIMDFSGPHKEYPLCTPVAGRPAPDTIRAPGYFLDKFFSHIGLTDNLLEGSGHVRVSHEFNAFPRTWSLAEIARSIERVAIDRALEKYTRDSTGKIEVNGSYKGLDIGIFCKLNEQRRETIHTAFVKETSSAGAYENREVDEANERLRNFRHPLLNRIVRHNLEDEHIWSTLAVAEEVIHAGQNPDLDPELSRVDRELLQDVRRALHIGEVRHPAHRAAIDNYKATWLPWGGAPRWW